MPSAPHAAISCGDRTLTFGPRTLLMGVVNVTPDSFSDGARFLEAEAAIRQALELEQVGADVLDIGGESTRPGAAPVSAEEELRRVLPVIESLARRVNVPLSIDTSKAQVARAALTAGASLINDVTALRSDPAMAAVAAETKAPVILMHMQGTPQTMQAQPHYDDVVTEVRSFLAEAIERATQQGIARGQLLIDPGLGFGKTLEHNLTLLAQLPMLSELGRPIVVGPSRKSFIGQLTGQPVDRRVWGTAAAVALAAWLGAGMVRVHDVAVMRDVVRVVDAVARSRA